MRKLTIIPAKISIFYVIRGPGSSTCNIFPYEMFSQSYGNQIFLKNPENLEKLNNSIKFIIFMASVKILLNFTESCDVDLLHFLKLLHVVNKTKLCMTTLRMTKLRMQVFIRN